jgi:hypothetical protein
MIEYLPPVEDAYPNARNAVAIMDRPEAAWCWDMYRQNGSSLDEVLEVLVRCAKDKPWAAETKTTDFRRFVGAKLGMM